MARRRQREEGVFWPGRQLRLCRGEGALLGDSPPGRQLRLCRGEGALLGEEEAA